MTRHWPIIATLVLALVTGGALASSKHHAGQTRHRAPAYVGHAPSFEPARMIEVRPGLIISSYDCVTDEGYGRYVPCSAGAKR